jgi:polyphosphate glucokinase
LEALGIDVGGTGIKGAIVDTNSGALLTPRLRLLTPQPATPMAVIGTIHEIVDHFEWRGPLGCGIPAAVKKGVALTASNISKHWIGFNVRDAIEQATGFPARVVNDADAAGLAEMKYGVGKGEDGVVLIVTLGTGIGTALFVEGRLVPNLEMGHIEMNGMEAEWYAAEPARKRDGLSWKKWGKRVGRYLRRMEHLLWPDLIIVGGGASRQHKRFFQHIRTQARLVPAQARNEAGIVGAALAGIEHLPI